MLGVSRRRIVDRVGSLARRGPVRTSSTRRHTRRGDGVFITISEYRLVWNASVPDHGRKTRPRRVKKRVTDAAVFVSPLPLASPYTPVSSRTSDRAPPPVSRRPSSRATRVSYRYLSFVGRLSSVISVRYDDDDVPRPATPSYAMIIYYHRTDATSGQMTVVDRRRSAAERRNGLDRYRSFFRPAPLRLALSYDTVVITRALSVRVAVRFHPGGSDFRIPVRCPVIPFCWTPNVQV